MACTSHSLTQFVSSLQTPRLTLAITTLPNIACSRGLSISMNTPSRQCMLHQLLQRLTFCTAMCVCHKVQVIPCASLVVEEFFFFLVVAAKVICRPTICSSGHGPCLRTAPTAYGTVLITLSHPASHRCDASQNDNLWPGLARSVLRHIEVPSQNHHVSCSFTCPRPWLMHSAL